MPKTETSDLQKIEISEIELMTLIRWVYMDGCTDARTENIKIASEYAKKLKEDFPYFFKSKQ